MALVLIQLELSPITVFNVSEFKIIAIATLKIFETDIPILSDFCKLIQQKTKLNPAICELNDKSCFWRSIH